MTLKRHILTLLLFLAAAAPAAALSLSLDSIATWGRFPRFCVNTYRWSSGFFNGYDTTYVKGTGYKFNVKAKADSWIDLYNFDLPAKMQMTLHTSPCTSAGVFLTYMAVTVGYQRNISKYFGSNAQSKQQLQFGFDCALFAFEAFYTLNKVGNTITRFGPRRHTMSVSIPFDGLTTEERGLKFYYFFNNKRYSQAAAFSYSRLQQKSQGSFIIGVDIRQQNFDFDFSTLPQYMQASLPPSWTDSRYVANTRNYSVKMGYGYNWVLNRHLVLGVSESPTVGLKVGEFNNLDSRTSSVAFYNQLRLSLVWNHRQWFAGLTGLTDLSLYYHSDNSFVTATLSATLCAGYRFNLF